jgi:hypothetical protein
LQAAAQSVSAPAATSVMIFLIGSFLQGRRPQALPADSAMGRTGDRIIRRIRFGYRWNPWIPSVESPIRTGRFATGAVAESAPPAP